MNNLIAFTNTFLSYLLCFIVFGVLILLAIFMGIKLRKNKNKKEELNKASDNLEEAFVQANEA